MRFENPDYPGTFSVKIVEVYYEDDQPGSWCEPHPAMIEDLDVLEDTNLEIKKAFSLEFLRVQCLMAEALKYPVLLASDFE